LGEPLNQGAHLRIFFLRLIFALAAIYDFAIGAAFLFQGPRLFDLTNVPAPNHWGYIYFGALLLMVFGLMFLAVTLDPVQHRNLIPFGTLLKASYCGVVGYYWIQTDVPDLFKPFVYADGLMFVVFWLAYWQLRRIAISYPREVMPARAV
jgi:hypothetical protein